jgi:hypothetical protein
MRIPTLADGDINADYSVLPEGGTNAVDATVQHMVEMAAGKWGRESPKIRAAAINIIRGLDPITGAPFAGQVATKDYWGMAEAIHNWVRDNIMYVKDPVGQETLSYPEETLFNSRAGDCLAAGTRLLTPKGYINIENVKPGMTIQGKKGWTKVLKFWDKGELPTFRVDLTNGGDIVATADHRFFLLDGTEKTTKELQVRDALLGPAKIELPEKTDFLTPDDFYFVGLYLADGWCSANKTCISGKDGFTKEAQKHWVQAWAEAKGWRTHWSPRYITVMIPKDHVLYRMLHDGRLAPEKAIPNEILAELTQENVRRLRDGLFADFHDPLGSKRTIGAEKHRKRNLRKKVYPGGGCYSTTSHDLAKQVRLLLRLEGYTCSDTLVVEHGGLGTHPVHRIYPRFFKTIPAKVEGIVEAGVRRVYDLQTADQGIYLPDADVVVHNCDDQVILEMALLGSVGIQSYPVIVGLYPNHYSHVYGYVEIPPGKHRYAGTTWAFDPIMKDWPLGREAPADRIKAKKIYDNLAGFNIMLHGYASSDAAMSPVDELEATQVPGVLASRLTDTGHRGQIMNAQRLTEWGDELDEMFNAEATISPMQAAPASMLYARGPIVSRAAREQTSYLDEAPLGGVRDRVSRRRGPLVVTIKDRPYGDGVTAAAKPASPQKTIQGLMGLADYLGDLAKIAPIIGKRMSVTGKTDALHAAAGAKHIAKHRAKKASAKVAQLSRQGFMPGFGADMQPDKSMDVALQIEKLAHQISAQADQIAAACAGSSPVRQQALTDDVGAMDYIERNAGATSIIDNADFSWLNDKGQAKVKSVGAVIAAQDPSVAQLALDLSQKDMPKAPGARVTTQLPGGAVVRDQMGNVIQTGSEDENDGLAGVGAIKRQKRIRRAMAGFGELDDSDPVTAALMQSAQGLSGLFSSVSHAAQAAVKTVVNPVQTAVRIAAAPVTMVKDLAQGQNLSAAYKSTAQGIADPVLQLAQAGPGKIGNALASVIQNATPGGKPGASAAPATVYQDANGNPISQGLYNALIANPCTPETCFDANGNPLNTAGCAYGTACQSPVAGNSPCDAMGPGCQCFNQSTGAPTGVAGCYSPSTGAACYVWNATTGPSPAPGAPADCASTATTSQFASYPGGQCFNPTTGTPTGASGCFSPSTGVACYSYAGPSAPPTPTNAAPDCAGAVAAQQPYYPTGGSSAYDQATPDSGAYDPNTGESLTSTPDYSNQGPPNDSDFGPDQMGPASQADNSQQDENTVAVSDSGGGGFSPDGGGITAGGSYSSDDDGSDDGSTDDGSGDATETPDDGSGDGTDVSQYNAPSQPRHKHHKYYSMADQNSDDADSGEGSDDDSDLDTSIQGDLATEDQWRGDNDLNEDEAGTGRGTVLSPPIEGMGDFSVATLAKPALVLGLGWFLWKKLAKRKRA